VGPLAVDCRRPLRPPQLQWFYPLYYCAVLLLQPLSLFFSPLVYPQGLGLWAARQTELIRWGANSAKLFSMGKFKNRLAAILAPSSLARSRRARPRAYRGLRGPWAPRGGQGRPVKIPTSAWVPCTWAWLPCTWAWLPCTWAWLPCTWAWLPCTWVWLPCTWVFTLHRALLPCVRGWLPCTWPGYPAPGYNTLWISWLPCT